MHYIHHEQQPIDYVILTENDYSYYSACSDLTKKVQKYIQNGWIPQGGISISSREVGCLIDYTICQAMIKLKKME